MADIQRIGLDEVARHFEESGGPSIPLSIGGILWSVSSSSL